MVRLFHFRVPERLERLERLKMLLSDDVNYHSELDYWAEAAAMTANA